MRIGDVKVSAKNARRMRLQRKSWSLLRLLNAFKKINLHTQRMCTQFTPDIRPGARLQTDPKECISVLLIAVADPVVFLPFFLHYHCVSGRNVFFGCRILEATQRPANIPEEL